jgi:hypothetical protein
MAAKDGASIQAWIETNRRLACPRSQVETFQRIFGRAIRCSVLSVNSGVGIAERLRRLLRGPIDQIIGCQPSRTGRATPCASSCSPLNTYPVPSFQSRLPPRRCSTRSLQEHRIPEGMCGLCLCRHSRSRAARESPIPERVRDAPSIREKECNACGRIDSMYPRSVIPRRHPTIFGSPILQP